MLLLTLFLYNPAHAQDSTNTQPDSICIQRDLPDVIRKWRHKPPVAPSEKTSSLLLFPVVGSNPATGFQFGAAGQYAFRGKQPGSLYSTIVGNLTFTTKNQVLFQVKNNVYALNDNFFLTGDWRYFLFSQSTYGLGTNAPKGGVVEYPSGIDDDDNEDSLEQPMKFNHIRFHQIISKEVSKFLYVGFGYHLDYYYQIEDQKLDTLKLLTSHYLYSNTYNFNTKNYTVSGLSLNMIMDTRDNLVNAYKGYFLNLNWRFSPKFLGSSQSSNMVNAEWRSFHGFSKRNPRHLLAFWALGNFSTNGDLPYLALPALGYDQRGRSGRGYTQGRYRGPKLVYGEAEYRFPISPCGGILGGVLFLNATTADRPDEKVKLFEYIQPGYGFGLRLMVDKRSRTNLQVDLGYGQKGTSVYFGASETF